MLGRKKYLLLENLIVSIFFLVTCREFELFFISPFEITKTFKLNVIKILFLIY